ncbi:hypothetical protein [Kordia sp.]|uniref:hypothetical protein n=1 Tax=Kordia sp. TaxID=1965332 RepID=UPI003D6AF37C
MKQILMIVTLLLTLTAFAQEKKCSDFKVGEFTYSDPDYADLITIRTDSFQTDSYPKIGLKTVSKVTWLTDCKYEIEYVEVSDPKMESLIGVKFVIEIIKINDNKILCRTKSEDVIIEKEMIKTQ